MRYVKLSLWVLVLMVALPLSAYAECRVTSGESESVTYTQGQLKDDICDTHGYKPTTVEEFNVELAGEDLTNLLTRVSGGAVRTITVMTGVTTNTTSAATTIFSGGKTPIAQVSGTGAVTATVKLYGDNDNTAANGILLCTITLTDTTKDVDVCTQFTADYPYYYATTESVTGTGATVEFIVAAGIAGSGSSSGGAVTNAGTFVVQENGAALTALQLLDNVVGVEDAAETAGTGLAMAGSVRRDTPASSAGATADNATMNTSALGALYTSNIDPCSYLSKTYVAINQITGTQLFTGTASKRTFVCQLTLLSATLQNIALVSGTGTVCATSLGPMLGGTTAATGFNFAANGGIVIGNGAATIAKSDTDADNVCILMSSTGQLSGVISYVAAADQ